MLNQLGKILLVNFSLTAVLTFSSLEIFLRIKGNYKGTSWTGTDYHSTINSAKIAANKLEDLTLVVGDSFAAHQKGMGGNMFDLVYQCKNNQECNYFNISIPGTNLETYWKSLFYVISSRPSSTTTNVIMSLYYGNDFPIANKEKKYCRRVFLAQNTTAKSNLITKLKKNSYASVFIYRFLKKTFSLGKNDQIELYRQANYLRNQVDEWLIGYPEYSKTYSKINESILFKIKNDILNPWEVSLALANPYYFTELYGLSKDWSKEALRCSLESFESNIRFLLKKNPSLKFTLIGIPDKLFWNPVTSKSVLFEYQEIGYQIGKLKNSQYNLIPEKFNKLSKTLNFKFINLPEIISVKDKDFSSYFYEYDMHLNRFGNVELSNYLKGFLYESEPQSQSKF